MAAADAGAASLRCRAVLLDGAGDLSSLSVRDGFEVPAPGPGQIRVRVAYAGLNPVDYKVLGMSPDSWTFPRAPGLDASGVVEAVGLPEADGGSATGAAAGAGGAPAAAHVKLKFAVGDRVHFHGDLSRPWGTCAEYALTSAATAVRVPDGVGLDAAAALPCAAWTAYQALHRRLHVVAGRTICIAGASGVSAIASCRVVAFYHVI